MKCPNCGAKQPETANFCSECGFSLTVPVCPRCGRRVSPGNRYCGACGTELSLQTLRLTPPELVRTAEGAGQTEAEPTHSEEKPGQKKGGKPRKRWKPALIIAVCLLLAAGGGFTAWWLLGSEDAQFVKAANNYAEVNEALLTVTTADGYDDLATAEKAEQVLNALDDLADEGKVLADSVGYDESYPLVYYSYADGAYGGVMLEEFAEDTSGVGESTYNTSVSYDEEEGTFGFGPWPSVPTFAMKGSPYTDNLSALIICDFGGGDSLAPMQSMQSSWNEAYLDTTLVEEGTVAFYRTGLSGYDLVVIQEHGYIYKNEPLVALQETVSINQFAKYKTGYTIETQEEREMFYDIQSNRVAMIYVYNDRQWQCHLFLMPTFFSYYYSDDRLGDAIVWIGCCDGYHNDALVSAFANCGAKAVLAPTESVNIPYNFLMQDAFVDMLLYGNTVEESLAFAQSQWGANDREFRANFGLEDTDPSEVRIYCGGDETLVTLTEEGQEALKGTCSGAVIDVTDGSSLVVGATITVTDADGTVAETTTDETGAFEITLYLGTYTVQIEKEGYESQTEEVTIEAGEESTLLVSLSAEISDDDLLYQYIPDDALVYDGHSYYYFADDSLEWEDANAYCESLGGHLVTITSEEEQDAVYNYISALVENVDIWIGISDSDEEGNWSTWITGETVTYTNWGSGEPDDYSDGQDYGVICCGTRNGSSYHVIPGQWDDVGAIIDYVNGSFICEWEYCADQNSDTDNTTEMEDPDSLDVAHGSCGDNLTWTYRSSGVLTISGTGEMWGWNPSRESNSAYTTTAITYEEIPWYDYKDQITSVVIEDGVTSIGICAFYECTSLTSVSIPSSVTTLHSQAFFGCTSLAEVMIPDSVTDIDDQVFYNCTSLASVVIGSDVTTIGYAAFYGCSSLTNVYYAGSESEWASIDIVSNNECLTDAEKFRFGA